MVDQGLHVTSKALANITLSPFDRVPSGIIDGRSKGKSYVAEPCDPDVVLLVALWPRVNRHLKVGHSWRQGEDDRVTDVTTGSQVTHQKLGS